jgi:DNA processing protein
VFAVPGPVHNVTSQGPHRLIKQGAKLVEGPEDILEELLPQLESPFRDRISTGIPLPTPQPPELEQDEQVMYDLITPNPVSLEELTSQGYFTPAEVMSILLSLELKGLIRQLPGAQYIRTSLR